MMKKIFFALSLLSGCVWTANARQLADKPTQSSQSQDTILDEAIAGGTLDYRVFGRYARDDAFYNRLVERFEQDAATLTNGEICTLYYGYAYRDEYAGDVLEPWRDLTKEHRYNEAYESICQALKANPAALSLLSDAELAGRKADRPEKEIASFRQRMVAVAATMLLLGDGTEQHPIPVMSVADEYTLMYRYFDVQILMQALTQSNGRPCDKMTVKPNPDASFQRSEIWFDISFPISMLDQPHKWAKELTANADEEN